MKTYHLNRFLKLKCAGDILGATYPINRATKEISEAMGIVQYVKRIALAEPGKYALLDFCSGNALVPIISIHLLPLIKAVAVDKSGPRRDYSSVRNFEYVKADITNNPVILANYLESTGIQNHNIILTACHACGELSEKTIEFYKFFPHIKHLILAPCCRGQMEEIPQIFKDLLGSYLSWSYHLYRKTETVGGKVSIVRDEHSLSPCNAIIKASK